MSTTTETTFPARLALIMYATWATTLGVWGRTSPLSPRVILVVVGSLMTLWCLIAAVRPSERRVEIALFGVAGFALWSSVRVIAADYDSAISIAAGVTYATTSVSARALASMTAVLAGIERAAGAHGADE